MKKILLFLIIILIPVNVSAADYIAKIEGPNIIHSKSDKDYVNEMMKTSVSIDVSNLDNISYLELYITYDTKLVGISTCHSFNFIAGGCDITSDNKIYYIYKGYYHENYPLFTATFMYTNNTPSKGNTSITVSFLNVKDKDGNNITISPVTKVFTFDEPVMRMSTTTTKNESDYKDNEKTSANNNVSKSNIKSTVKENYTRSNIKDNSINNNNENNNEILKEDTPSKTVKKIKQDIDNKKIIDRKTVKVLLIAAICIIFIGSIYLVIVYKKDKKLNKMLDDFDKF